MRTSITLLVLVHTVISIVHGMAHAFLGVGLPLWGTIYVVLMVFCAPLIAMGLYYARGEFWGAWLLLISMTGALVFGLFAHYVIEGSDHVGHIPAGTWQLAFQSTAALLLISEAAGVFLGVWAVYEVSRSAYARLAR